MFEFITDSERPSLRKLLAPFSILTPPPLPVLVVATLLGFYTGNKLVRMCRIQGWLPGATISSQRVSEKWHEKVWVNYRSPVTESGFEHTYWVSWGSRPIREPGPHRVNLSEEAWSPLRHGDLIDLVWLPDDPMPYTRNGIFVEPGHFVLDSALLTLWIVGVIHSALRIWRRAHVRQPVSPSGNNEH